jgi:hypothetical protein
MEREALKLALEALKEISRYATTPWEDEWCGELANETLKAINALAQPEQEPVKYKCTVVDDQHPQGIPLEQWGDPPAAQRPWLGLTKEDMPAGENPMFDHEYFIKGMVFAANILKEKNNG